MSFLIPTKNLNINGVTVKQVIIPDKMTASKYVASWCQKGWKMKPCKAFTTSKPLGITVHNTPNINAAKGTNPAEQYCRATYNGNMSGVIVHYYIWHSEVWQLLDLNEQGWHARDGSSRKGGHKGQEMGGNVDTIAMELIGPDKQTEQTAQKLIAGLCSIYGFTKEDIYTHNWWMWHTDSYYPKGNKNCPYYILPHWQEFLDGINIPKQEDKKYLYRVQVGAYSVEANANALAKKLKKQGYPVYIKKEEVK